MKNIISKSITIISFLFLICTSHLNAQDNEIKGKLYGVGTGGQIGEWDGTGFIIKDATENYRVIAVNSVNNETWVVGSGANAGIYRWKEGGSKNWKFLGGWRLGYIAFNKKGEMWGLELNGNTAKWDGEKWVNKGRFGGWALRCIAFDNNDEMWGVGTGGQLAKLKNGTWEEQPGGGQWQSIAFDRDNQMWGVATNGHTGKYNDGKWEHLGVFGGWALHSLLFLEEDPIIKAAEGGWKDLPSTNVASIRILQVGTTIETEVSSSIGTNLLTANENSNTKDWSITESISIEKEATVPLAGKVKATMGFSSTQSESVTNIVKKQMETSLNESTAWKITQPCPPTKDGYVRFAITENITRVRQNPMSISVPGRETVYMQEYVNLTVVNFSKEYKMSSPEIQAYWNELNSKHTELMSKPEYNLYVR